MLRTAILYVFLFVLFWLSHTNYIPKLSNGFIILLCLALLLYSWLYVRHVWKVEFNQRPEINRIDLLPLKPSRLGLIFLVLAVVSLVILGGYMVYQEGIYADGVQYAFVWMYLIIICERAPIYVWHLFPGRHVLFFSEKKVVYIGLHLQVLQLDSLKAIKGEWKMIKGDKEKWQLDQFSDVQLVSYPLMGVKIPLKYLRPKDETRLKSLLGEIMIQYKPKVAPGLEIMKIEAIGKRAD